ncbi:MAG: Clp protease ClpP [Bacteroidales bacterium]|nr:Clp protease ClpP [Bacteroidales bacterium]
MAQTQYHLHLKGYVGGYDFDRNYVDYVLARNEGKPVNVLIDSLGGSLATALSIASAFKQHGDVTVHFVGMNASAATIASLGARRITMDASAMYLVHKCSAEFFEWGNLNADQLAAVRDNCEAAIRDLNKLDNNVASMYASKTSKPHADLLDLMREGGWLSAKEALEWGFVDEITDLGETKPVLTDAVASALAEAGLPIPNVPTDSKETLFARFLASIASLFKTVKADTVTDTVAETQANEVVSYHNDEISNQNKPSDPMNLLLPLLGKVLNIEGFAVGEEGSSLSLDQFKSVEAALSVKDKRIAELADELAAVKKSPADSSTAVINEGTSDKHQPQDEVQQYVETCNQAQALYNLVP